MILIKQLLTPQMNSWKGKIALVSWCSSSVWFWPQWSKHFWSICLQNMFTRRFQLSVRPHHKTFHRKAVKTPFFLLSHQCMETCLIKEPAALQSKQKALQLHWLFQWLTWFDLNQTMWKLRIFWIRNLIFFVKVICNVRD